MAKLQELFTQARRTQSGSSMGFLSKNRGESKAHAAALVVELAQTTIAQAEAALKAGADGLLFTWDGKTVEELDTFKPIIEAAKGNKPQLVTGLRLTGNWQQIDTQCLASLKEQGINYILLPIDAPVHLLALEVKDLEKVVTVPMQKGELYPLYIRTLTSIESVAAVQFDFAQVQHLGELSIAEALSYRAVRNAIQAPAFLELDAAKTNEQDAYALLALGIQAVIVSATAQEETTREQVHNLRLILEKVHKEEKEQEAPSLK